MAVKSMKMERGYSDKQSARVLTVDQQRRRVELALRDGGIVYAAVWDIPPLFRWPKTGEVWTIRRDSGIWRLDALVENLSIGESSTPLEELGEGQARVISEVSTEGSGLLINNFHAARVATFSLGDGILTIFPIAHKFGTENVIVSIRDVGAMIYVEADVDPVDENNLTITFGVAPTANQYSVTLTA